MTDHQKHDDHDHVHGADCGHTPIFHGDHTDYLHDGHLHRAHGAHTDECAIAVDAANPAACTPAHAEACTEHAAGHVHGAGCGHEAVPHGDHMDFLVGAHLHHPHGAHCDDHGMIAL